MAKVCATCPSVILLSDVTRGCTRCRSCRRVSPGRIVRAHGHANGGGKGWRSMPSASVSKRQAVRVSTDSWWIGIDRVRLNAEAERRFVTYATPAFLAVNTKGILTGAA